MAKLQINNTDIITESSGNITYASGTYNGTIGSSATFPEGHAIKVTPVIRHSTALELTNNVIKSAAKIFLRFNIYNYLDRIKVSKKVRGSKSLQQNIELLIRNKNKTKSVIKKVKKLGDNILILTMKEIERSLTK